jgi:hypothetical protein
MGEIIGKGDVDMANSDIQAGETSRELAQNVTFPAVQFRKVAGRRTLPGHFTQNPNFREFPLPSPINHGIARLPEAFLQLPTCLEANRDIVASAHACQARTLGIVTFLMVFLLQNTQNRDAKDINLKLDELIYSNSSAKDQMIDIEKLSDKELEGLAKRYEKVRQECLDRKERSSKT